MIFKNQSVSGGYNGAPVKAPAWVNPDHPSTRFLGLNVGDGKQPSVTTAIFCLVAVVLLCYLVANLRRSTTGRQMLAMRSNERAAAAAGVNVSGTKALAFAISAFIAGIGGAVIAYRSGNATADKFDYTKSLVFFAFAYLGGISSVSGAIAGGFLVAGGLVFTFLQQTLGVPSEFTLMLGGLGLILSAILNPEGFLGAHVLQLFSFPSGDPAEFESMGPDDYAALEFAGWFQTVNGYADMNATDRQNVLEILRETKPEFSAWLQQQRNLSSLVQPLRQVRP